MPAPLRRSPFEGLLLGSRSDAGIADGAHGYQPIPNEQHNNCADQRANKSGALVDPIPADRLANEGCEERSHDAEHGGEDETRRLIRAGRNQASDDTSHKSDNDDPENTHYRLPCSTWTSLKVSRRHS